MPLALSGLLLLGAGCTRTGFEAALDAAPAAVDQRADSVGEAALLDLAPDSGTRVVGVTGAVSRTLDELVSGLPGVLALDRSAVRRRVVQRFGPERLVDAHLDLYRRLHVEATSTTESKPR